MAHTTIQHGPAADLSVKTGWDAWEDVVSYSVSPGDGSQKRFIGSADPRVCKFCGRSRPEAKFRNDSHVIPAAFGNRSLFSYEECDDCNELGSRVEDDFAKWLAAARAISRIPARSGNPKIRKPNEESYIQGNRHTNKVHVFQPNETEAIQVVDDDNGNLRLRVATQKHRPVNVARALGRMMLFILPVTHDGFGHALKWVRGESDWFPIPLVVLNLPYAFKYVGLTVHRYTRAPRCRILKITFSYHTFVVTMPVPLDEWSLPEDFKLLNYPEQYRDCLQANTSEFWIRDDAPDDGGFAEFNLTYRERTESRPTEERSS